MLIPAVKGMLGLNTLAEDGRYQGFKPVDLEWTSDFADFKAQYPNGRSVEISENILRDLNAIIDISLANNAKVILVFPPAYYEIFPLFSNYTDIKQIYKNLARSKNIDFFDYSNAEISNSTDNFYNSQHLNFRGAKKFSSIFARDLKERFNLPLNPPPEAGG
jgi:lysophospholipase L1-like esterase